MDEDANAMIVQMSYNVVEGENEVLINVRETIFTLTFITTVGQTCSKCRSEADSGFSRGRALTFKVGIILQTFCRKLHENENIWNLGGRVPGVPPLDPPM